MKYLNTIAVTVLSLVFIEAQSQSEAPKGFVNGNILLTDGSTLTGFVKDNIRKSASVTFTNGVEKKKAYEGSALLSAEIEGEKFICIKGDFFKLICEGELSFLQKSSDASAKPTYNGSEAVFVSGTEGKLNDYFIYNNNTKQLHLVSKKNVDQVTATSFADCRDAIEKAKTINGDLSQLKVAVETYNNRNN
jgi:hypothetical protein